MDEASTLHPSHETLAGRLDDVRAAPAEVGVLRLIVARPEVDKRTVLKEGELDLEHGLVGDSWAGRLSSRADNGDHRYDNQLNIMNARATAAVAVSEDRWPLAGDQLYFDLDLSEANLPAGTRVQVGDQAVIEVTAKPHTGCGKFAARFGRAAWKWVNSPEGKELKLRGINARIITGGTIRVGDRLTKLLSMD